MTQDNQNPENTLEEEITPAPNDDNQKSNQNTDPNAAESTNQDPSSESESLVLQKIKIDKQKRIARMQERLRLRRPSEPDPT